LRHRVPREQRQYRNNKQNMLVLSGWVLCVCKRSCTSALAWVYAPVTGLCSMVTGISSCTMETSCLSDCIFYLPNRLTYFYSVLTAKVSCTIPHSLGSREI